MPTAVAQPSFASGELAPSLYGRVDIVRYYTALKTCRNFIVRPYGGVVNRPGLLYCGEVKDSSKAVRLIPFEYSATETLVIELGDYYARFWSDGAPVLYTSGPNTGDPVEVTTPWSAAELFDLRHVQSADVVTFCHPDHQPRQLSRYSNESWTLTAFGNQYGPFQEMNLDEALTVKSTAATGSVTLTASQDLFTADMVGMLIRLEQEPDTGTPRWEVEKDVVAGDVRRAGASYYKAISTGKTGTVRPSVLEGQENDGSPGVVWEYLHSGFGVAQITAVTDTKNVTATVVKTLPQSVLGTIAISNVVKVATGLASGYMKITTTTAHGLSAGQTAVISDVVGTTDINGPWVVATVQDATNFTIDTRAVDTLLGTYVDTVDYTTGVSTQLTLHFTPTDLQILRFEFDGSAPAVTHTVSGAVVTFSGPIVAAVVTCYEDQTYDSGGTVSGGGSGATYKWSLGAWGDDPGYPHAVTYHQQRQVFGGTDTHPQTIWESAAAGAYTDFDQSVPLLDDDAMTFELAGLRVNQIMHFVTLRELVALTHEGVWVIRREEGAIIPKADFQGRGGASRVPPVVVGNDALYIQNKGGVVKSLRYAFDSDGYQGKDLTLTANHLLKNRTVVDWAYQEIPFGTVWIVRDDGALLGLTYLPEQDVVGWHRHDTDGLVESVCSVTEGDEDAVYVVVKRTIMGQTVRYIERLAHRFVEDRRDYVFLDSALSYDGRDQNVTFTLTTSAGWTHQDSLTITTTTDVFVGASDIGDVIVLTDSDGVPVRLTILAVASSKVATVIANRTVPVEFRGVSTGFDLARNTLSGLDHLEGESVTTLIDGNPGPAQTVVGGQITISPPGVVVHAGLPITADIETLDLNVQGQTVQDKFKNINSVLFIVEETRGIQAGPDANNLLTAKPEMSGEYDNPVSEVTGALEINVLSDWSRGGRVFVRQEEPLPVSILAAIPQVVVSGA